ncbi:hypothetical protein PVAND_016536 [Polypedilum vanderplanki]|uniref:ARF7 effector protein C-terminal domain-containing protein n=1 Tax=Polypedilum vanderplanki TaxID=319348 RepID=A0A9J6BG30_POLVA|nr:hypothetical protein PVAND_016536 [Polypedilum vanderplanki]
METARKSTSLRSNIFSPITTRNGTRVQPRKPQQLLINENSMRPSNSISYDSQGRIRGSQEDICDCMDTACLGCHFECERCKSKKCGPSCRVNRRYTYETIVIDGTDRCVRNPKLIV